MLNSLNYFLSSVTTGFHQHSNEEKQDKAIQFLIHL